MIKINLAGRFFWIKNKGSLTSSEISHLHSLHGRVCRLQIPVRLDPLQGAKARFSTAELARSTHHRGPRSRLASAPTVNGYPERTETYPHTKPMTSRRYFAILVRKMDDQSYTYPVTAYFHYNLQCPHFHLYIRYREMAQGIGGVASIK